MQSKLLSFFSTRAVKEKILTGTLSQAELFIYFYLIMLFDCFGLTQQTLEIIGKNPRFIDYFHIWQTPIISVIGILFLFLANGGGRGRDFLSKYFTFSFTVGIKYYVFYIILELLPFYFPALASRYYEIPVNVLINTIMAANIGWRIYQIRA